MRSLKHVRMFVHILVIGDLPYTVTVKVKKTKIIYNVAIDTQLELLKKFQRDRVISYIE